MMMNFSKQLNSLKIFCLKLIGKKIGSDFHNVYHPEFADKVEPAFEANGKQYFRFIRETSIPWSRYMVLQTFLHEQSLRIDMELLQGYINMMKKALNPSAKTGVVDMSTVHKIIGQIGSRCELAFETETTYRLASVMYFDDQEDLYSYDKGHNEKKIQSWKEAGTVDFFYTRPMSELLGLSDLTHQDLRTYMAQSQEILRYLTIETPEP
jgi:hypothetical protein